MPQPGDKNDGTWGDGWKDRGGPAIWGLMTVDTERGMVFLPTGNPGGSFYGGDRPGDNLYAVSVLALDAATGAYKWHYQTTRHDIFDADLAAAPALIDVVRDGKRIPGRRADHQDGRHAVHPRSPDRQADLRRRGSQGAAEHGARREERADAAVPDQAGAVGAARHDQGGPHDGHARVEQVLHRVVGEASRCTTTAPTRRTARRASTVVFSGTIGGGNWGGVAFNPQLGYVFVNTSNLATIGRMVPDPAEPGQYRNELAYTRFWDDNKYPCQQPPWGELVAVNANTGDIAWKIPLGIYPELVAKGIPPTGTPNLGGPIATASGLVFIGATKDARFRAFDAKTGKELWYAQLEAAGAATPMTFMGRDGKQYVVIAAGGPGDTDRGGTEQYPQKLVAFALSDRATTAAAGGAARRRPCPTRTSGGAKRRRRVSRGPGAGPPRDRTCLHGVSRPRRGNHRGPARRGRGRRVVDEMIAMGAQASADEARTVAAT